MLAAGTRAPSKRTCPNSLVTPFIIRSGRCSTPGWCIGERERREALVAGRVGVGAGEQQAPVGDVGVARPDLVPVDHVLVAVARRGRAQRREVGAGVGLAEPLAPALAPADEPGEEAVLDRVAPVGADALHEIAQARPRRRAGSRELLVEDHVEDGREVVAAEPGRPAQAEEAGVVQRRVPLRLAGPVLVVGRRRREPGVVVRQPGAQPRPELGLGRRVTEVHRPPPVRASAMRRSCTPSSPNHCDDSSARRRYTCAMHSHVLPMPPCTCTAVSHTVRAARAAVRLRARVRRQPLRAATRASTAHDACSVALCAPSMRQCASASRCCTAWNEPTGTPNCRRSRRVGDRQVEHTSHHAHQIRARECEPERRTRRRGRHRSRARPTGAPRPGDDPCDGAGQVASPASAPTTSAGTRRRSPAAATTA